MIEYISRNLKNGRRGNLSAQRESSLEILLASDVVYSAIRYWYITIALFIVAAGLLTYAIWALNKLANNAKEQSELKRAIRSDSENDLKKQRERAKIIKEDTEENDRLELLKEGAVTADKDAVDFGYEDTDEDISGVSRKKEVPENEDYRKDPITDEEASPAGKNNGEEGADFTDDYIEIDTDDETSDETEEDIEDMATKKTEKETVRTAKEETTDKKESAAAKEKTAPKKSAEKKEKVVTEQKTETAVKEENLQKETVEKGEIKAVYRVIYDKENKEWLIKKDGAARVIRRVKTKAEALELATQFAENQELNITVQKKDGKFQKKTNYRSMIDTDKTNK